MSFFSLSKNKKNLTPERGKINPLGFIRSNPVFSNQEISRFALAKNIKDIQANNVRGPYAKWTLSGNVKIGAYTSINGVFNARGDVNIGKYCAFGQYVALISTNHAVDMVNQQVWLQQRLGFKICMTTKGAINIGHNVWIGDKATVLSGVNVGHGAVIAANSAVTKDVPDFAIVGGNPARIIKYRFSEPVIKQFLDIKWWDWSFEKMQKNQQFFEAEILADDETVDLSKLIV